jgi:Ala-tRNA(Pro) deacylase
MPPFGNLYDMGVFVAQQLTEDDEIAFNAGSHTELVRMAYEDYAKLVTPQVVSLT